MRYRDLPLGALRTFAIVAEAGTVTRAAEVLGVTHSAVSKQLRVLEDLLGQAVFIRNGRRLALSPFGELLSARIGPALREMSEAFEQVHRHRGRRIITVEAPATFAMHWLMPRLHKFKAVEPQVDVWVSTRVTGQKPDTSRHDVVIIRGEHQPLHLSDRSPHTILVEQMTLIAPGHLPRDDRLVHPKDIRGYPMIGSSTRPDDWSRWLKLAGLDFAMPGGGHRFDHLFVAMQAVRDGLGITVAPKNLFGTQLQRGDLACPFPDLWFEGMPYIGYQFGNNTGHIAVKFLSWLSGEEQIR
ncbi:LysR substrate-binding domain-containing protein [Methylobacterium sp. J-070]|uniref:LysR substrate-binding domain-containing protein n=1 Tax=Methylobacterium sp. J-070 TaxID=2836650 RepID=UPI001FB96A58|nr:LysR substrate-binding domain-containing protein [Methylobacterium sp. J-070]MCJ2048468.1 LysR substrate-binding domain-containing protein [Methylobacterium sp. J-070]